jgi:hypothetical protein
MSDKWQKVSTYDLPVCEGAAGNAYYGTRVTFDTPEYSLHRPVILVIYCHNTLVWGYRSRKKYFCRSSTPYNSPTFLFCFECGKDKFFSYHLPHRAPCMGFRRSAVLPALDNKIFGSHP